MSTVHGFAAPGYDDVAEAIATCGPGVAVAAIVAGEVVVDAATAPLTPRSLVHTWSAIKPITGACVLLLVERGALDLDQPVASVWPELVDPDLLVRHVLTHTAGRVSAPATDPADWDATTAALAAQPADARPGELICEHALTFGFLAGELVRRVDGRSLGTFFREEVAGPLDLDIHIGVPTDELHRVADTVGLTPAWWTDAGGEPTGLRSRSLGAPPDVNTERWRRAEIPAVNGHATPLGLATWYQRLLEGRLPALVGAPGVTGPDAFVGEEVTWTLAGGRIDGDDIGMGGLGGQWAAANPSRNLAWVFLTSHVGDFDRAQRVEDALLAALG